MDWRSVNFDWNRARAFLVTAEEGSLSAAARALGTTQPTLGRQVAALEEELGLALFERGSRGLALTPGGLSLLEHARAMGEAASALSLTASGQSQSLEGSICISATEVGAAYVLPPVLRRLRALEPRIDIEVVASNAASDLRRREADIALRAFRPPQPDLIARRLGDVPVYAYASPAYLAALGHPRRPADFGDAVFIRFNRAPELPEALRGMGLPLTERNFSLTAENHLVQWELVKAGLGIGLMPASIGDAEPAVQRILEDLPPLMTALWLVTHRELRTNRRVRRVFDFLAIELGE